MVTWHRAGQPYLVARMQVFASGNATVFFLRFICCTWVFSQAGLGYATAGAAKMLQLLDLL